MAIKSFPLIMILILFISSFTMPLIKNNRIIKSISFITNLVCLILSIFTFDYVKVHGDFKYRMGHFDAPWGIEFKVGAIECLMAILFTCVCFFIIWYSMYSIEKNIKKMKIPFYYLLINILLASFLGMVFTNDIFNAFVFIEVSTLASCGIIAVKDDKESIKATIKYIVLSSLGSGLVLLGIAFIYSITGNLNMEFISMELSKHWTEYRKIVTLSIGLFVIGLGIKGAIFPLHIWMADAYSSAIDTTTALLAAIGAKAIVILFIKILYRVFGYEIINEVKALNLILFLGVLGMIMGSVFSIYQKNSKRVIAYSSVAQMGYIFLGIGLSSAFGLASAMFHIIGHAFTKSALFLCIDSMRENTGDKICDLRGIGKEMPITLGLFSLGALSMVGIPILPGFLSKWNLSVASIQADKIYIVTFILVSSLLNIVYYSPIVINGYFGEENLKGKVYMSKEKNIKEIIPIMMLIGMMVCVGLFSNYIMKILLTACEQIF
ncbi:complex I subunit 5 family protein [Tepidibacter sp. Z1-5]|uniref:complex I subunit 5 family protein n=1 Tax=Tepidibacter sp. Z1-5 TaxID=3134138 RepID=UPI0030BD06A2